MNTILCADPVNSPVFSLNTDTSCKGRPILVLWESGNSSEDEFGSQIFNQGTTQNVYRYTGQQSDADSGLQYLRARYYEPSTGRFITKDPKNGDPKDPASLNLYVYCQNNPINYSDPSGYFKWKYNGLIELESGDTPEKINKSLHTDVVSRLSLFIDKFLGINLGSIFPDCARKYLLGGNLFGEKSKSTACTDFAYAFVHKLCDIPNTFNSPDDFLKYLFQNKYTSPDIPDYGDVTIYFKEGKPVHAGIYLSTDNSGERYDIGQMGWGENVEIQTESKIKADLKADTIIYYRRYGTWISPGP